MPINVMIVDDDRLFARSAAELVRSQGASAHVAGTLGEARSLLRRIPMQLSLVDLELPDGSGLELVRGHDPAVHGPLAIVTANPSIETAAASVSAPVLDYLIKPFDPERLATIVRHAVHVAGAAMPITSWLPGVATQSDAMRQPMLLARRVAPSDARVFLEGETGTGKEVFARAIHEVSERKGPFVAINCGAVPHELLASQLFGHERGSFTGAIGRHAGVFEQASGGTLFLDEVTEMPVDLQVYLLRALETGTVRRVGGDAEIALSARVIAASNRDPREAVAQGLLREDLYYRLAEFSIRLPPLRERGDDAVLLAQRFVEELNATHGTSRRLAFGSAAVLRAQRWSGNVRELRNVVFRSWLLSNGDAVVVAPPDGVHQDVAESADSILFPLGMSLAEMERRALQKALAWCKGDKTAAARLLGISVRTVHNHLARLRRQDAGDGAAA